jgi:hypothetical protein
MWSRNSTVQETAVDRRRVLDGLREVLDKDPAAIRLFRPECDFDPAAIDNFTRATMNYQR